MTVDELIERIRGKDEKARGEAWQAAGPLGAAAVKPLAGVAADAEMEVARAARRALWKVVRHAGRPGADAERTEVAAAILALLPEDRPPAVRRELLGMVSEIHGPGLPIAPVAALLSSPEVREEARMALERIPGEESLRALKEALASAPADFKPNLAVSLRARGVEVPGIPDAKLVPAKPTRVKPIPK